MSHFSKELQNGVRSQRLNLFSARKEGTIGINWSPMSYDKALQEEDMNICSAGGLAFRNFKEIVHWLALILMQIGFYEYSV